MGKRGPPPKPTVLKLLQGNPGHRPINRQEPKPAKAPKGSRRCPAWLPPAGKREWRRCVPELEKLGLLSKIDDAVLEGYCAAYARALQYERHITKMGATVISPKGGMAANPAVRMAQAAWAQVRAFASEFGLSPSGRGRMNVKPTPAGDDADELDLFGDDAKIGGRGA